MQEELKKRSEVQEQLTWDLSALYQTREEFQQAVDQLKQDVEQFSKKYEGNLSSTSIVLGALTEFESIMTVFQRTNQYAYLPASTDLTNSDYIELSRYMQNVSAELATQLSFFDTELMSVDTNTLDEAAQSEPRLAPYIRHIKKNKDIRLDPAVEKALAQLSPVLSAPESIYDQAKLADMDFGTFTVDGKDYPLSFVLYEDYYAFHPDADIRRAAFDKFSAVLRQYQNVVATTYYTQIQYEKTMATMRGFDSVIDYLLYGQEVDQELYNRQIDIIMSDLAPVMRKYAAHLKEVHSLDKITYADLKIDLDTDYSMPVTIEESKDIVADAVSSLGDDYTDRIMKAYPERWVDFVQNVGKSTGGFCSTTYDTHPYILMSWTNQLSDVYTLIHELGHAGQGILTNENNSILGSTPSLYLIEAPSTFNELLLTDYLQRKSDDPRQERFALTKMISNTYFHNFVTHLLEAAYQREVYRLVDAGKGFDAAKLSELKRGVLEQFWGEDVEINPGAELTWMRQPHYYMGLYPYTYSAGLTIATQAFLKLKEEGQPMVENWLEFLKLGDQKEPVEAAAVAGVDITTSKPLDDTIHYLDETVDRIIALTEQI
ncbi:oligoendopeptidase F [Atopococcus tabaci]|uniref:oligoendopeptidase F n=1 Tax=Atopococcus tabaci TaxID=269774 RepID=UPI00240A1C5F|nr:oligoendopeptidase F [Atopococcus tabaci]